MYILYSSVDIELWIIIPEKVLLCASIKLLWNNLCLLNKHTGRTSSVADFFFTLSMALLSKRCLDDNLAAHLKSKVGLGAPLHRLAGILRAPLQMAARSLHVSTERGERAARAQCGRLGALYKMSEQAGGEGGGPTVPAEPATIHHTSTT